MGLEQQNAIRRWAELFNAGEYFAAHEVLEGPWLRAAEPDKTFLKGLIHAAVALHHYRRGNGHGARVKYRSALRYLADYRPRFSGVDVDGLAASLEQCFAGLLAQPPGTPVPAPQAWPQVELRPES